MMKLTIMLGSGQVEYADWKGPVPAVGDNLELYPPPQHKRTFFTVGERWFDMGVNGFLAVTLYPYTRARQDEYAAEIERLEKLPRSSPAVRATGCGK